MPRAAVSASSPAAPNTWRLTGRMTTARGGHTATLLADGKILVAGGSDAYGVFDSAELYDPATGTWAHTGRMSTLRNLHVAARLNDGKVLVAAGFNGGGVLASAELYEPATGTWTATVSMATPRSIPASTLLAGGKLLVAGGLGLAPDQFIATAEIYDPALTSIFTPHGKWTTAGSLNTPRAQATLTLLPDGKALAVGGLSSGGTLASAELYDPGAGPTGTWSPVADMNTPRAGHHATLVSNQQVLIVGGYNDTGPLASAELYDPNTGAGGTWTLAPDMKTARDAPTGVTLKDGRILITGGEDPPGPAATAQIYDPQPPTWEAETLPVGTRRNATATLLPKGTVLYAGGDVGNTGITDALSSAELFQP